MTKEDVLFSQNDEDKIISDTFKVIGTKNKWCIEFGAVDGISGSNTRNLIINHGWSGILIEANRAQASKLKKNYANNTNVYSFCRLVNFEGDNTLDRIIAETPAPKDIDFISIDIDGNDYHVWDSLKEFTPRVVIIEFNFRIPPQIPFIQPRDISLSWGSSAQSLIELGKSKGYEPIAINESNVIFVVKDEYVKLNIEDNSIGKLWEESVRAGNFFINNDGSIILYNMDSTKMRHCYKKKILGNPVWYLEEGALTPVTFQTESKLVRKIKNLLKANPLFTLMYPMISSWYSKNWSKRRANINSVYKTKE